MKKINFEYKDTNVPEKELLNYQQKIIDLNNKLEFDYSLNNDYLGWLKLPEKISKCELEKIKKASAKVRKNSDVFVVIGIGGSYLGSRVIIDSLTSCFANLIKKDNNEKPIIIYAGNNVSNYYLNDLLFYLKDKDFSINVISKSGKTLEPMITFSFLKKLLERKYGKDEARKRIFVTTSDNDGVLNNLALKEHYETFFIPKDIGGRYSSLTAVGLFPAAVLGIDIEKIIKGAKNAQKEFSKENILKNDCYKYAVIRNILYKKGKKVEVFANYEPQLHYVNEWLKQLFGESEGKEQKGILPVGVDYTTDLHSMGQYIQDGERMLFETVISIKNNKKNYAFNNNFSNDKTFDYLNGKYIDDINNSMMKGTIKAHVSGGVPNNYIEMSSLDEENIGYLIYFFEKACAISGLLLGVNPFNQPGVEEYKNNSYNLLKKSK